LVNPINQYLPYSYVMFESPILSALQYCGIVIELLKKNSATCH